MVSITRNDSSFNGSTDNETVLDIFHCMGLSWNFYEGEKKGVRMSNTGCISVDVRHFNMCFAKA